MDWTRGQVIGHGSSATVFLASSSPSRDIFAVKSAELSRSESLQREQQILSSLTCPHIIGYRGYDITRENNGLIYNLFMEYMPDGSLADVIHRGSHRQLNESLIRFYTRQIVQGLQFIHSKGLAHCDIKASNILISHDGVKIADFGCAKWAAAEADTVPIGGTPLFMAPEAARGEKQGYPSDIWSLGCTVIEMATGNSAWPEVSDPISTLYRIGYSNESPKIPSILSHKAKDFLSKCLKRDPKERFSANQLLKHPFLVELNSIPKQNHQVYSDSPTSILDQGIWNSTEEIKVNTQSNSDKIRLLSKLSGKGKWESEDGNWITIRKNYIGKSKEVGGEEEEDMIGGSEKVSSNNNNNGGGSKEWLELVEKNVSCRISINHLDHHTCRKISLVHNHYTIAYHRDLAKVVSLMPSIL